MTYCAVLQLGPAIKIIIYTAKYLISVTPQGTVSYVSKGYGG